MTPTRMPLAEMIAAVELARDLRRSQAEAFRRSALDALSLSSPDGTTASYQRDARKIAKQADALDAVLASLRERETPQEEPPASLAREAPPPMTPPQERETLIAGLEQVRDETIQGRAADLARWDDTAERLFRERLLLLDACLAHLRAEPPTESEIDCPACGETVKQVASATLGLALWQHWNWTCQKRAERTPPEPPYKETLSRWRSAVRLYVEWTGGVHVDDCPEDDTCECDGKPANDGINALMRDLDALIAEAESSPSPARGAQTPAERCPLCSFDPTSLNDYCDEHRPRFTHAAAPAAPTEDHYLKRERELCNRCGGNGVLPVRNDEGLRIGIQTCPRCGGLCWEDHA